MKVAAFDLDRTLIIGNSSLSFCRYLRKMGILSQFDLFYSTLLYVAHFFFGLSLWAMQNRVFERLFQGHSASELSIYLAPFIKTLEWYEPALSRLNSLRKEGWEVSIFSSSPRFLVEPIAALIGVKRVVATDYAVDKNGRFYAMSLLVDGEKKSQALLALGTETMAFSDSHVDLPFLEAAQKAVVVHPTRRLAKIARARHWEFL